MKVTEKMVGARLLIRKRGWEGPAEVSVVEVGRKAVKLRWANGNESWEDKDVIREWERVETLRGTAISPWTHADPADARRLAEGALAALEGHGDLSFANKGTLRAMARALLAALDEIDAARQREARAVALVASIEYGANDVCQACCHSKYVHPCDPPTHYPGCALAAYLAGKEAP